MIATLFVLACLAIAAIVVTKIRHRRNVEGEALEAHPVIERDVQETIRQEIAPQTRPYRPATHIVDTKARDYLVDRNGTVRRVVLIPKGEGHVVLCATKMGKKRRKAQKRARQHERFATSEA